ncbi:MAG: FAD-dependent oxidoreductase [Bacteroidota bacterium]
MKQYELSYWEWDQYFRAVDVLVIGSGIVGLSAAIQLKEKAPQLAVTVVDRGTLPLGASTRNAGFACIGSLGELLADLADHSRTAVLDLVALRYRGLTRLRTRYGDAALGYQAVGGYELFRAEEQEQYAACRQALPNFNRDLAERIPQQADWPAAATTDIFCPADHALPRFGLAGVDHLLFNRAEGQIDTGRMMRTLLRRAQALDIPCLNGLTVTELASDLGKVHVATAAGWSFSVGQVIVATNGFAQTLLPDLPVQPARNQVLITAPIPDLPLRGTFHYDQGYVYFRNVGDRLLLGGGRNLAPAAETTSELGPHPEIRATLLKLLTQQLLPNQPVHIERWWSGILGVGPQKQPLVATVAPGILVAVRLGGMGVAIGTLVGEEAAERLLQ